ncbi:Flagellar hook-associated protein FlgL [Chitinispirillum alkaliphilum]|nr:Flagellar hook-associated protein FlgL [Chitinispirillum alkaliphilum]
MRTTFKTVNRNMQNVIGNRYGDLARLQEQISTGKRLHRASDDPVDVANALKLRTSEKQLRQFQRNIKDGLGYMSVSESAMNSMNDLMQRMRELGIQASTDTIGQNERAYIQQEVNQLSRQMIALALTQFKGDYVFNGTQTKTPPFIVEKSSANTAQDYNNMRMAYFMADGAAEGTTVQLFEGFSGTPVRNILPGSFHLSAQGVTYSEGVDYSVNYQTGEITLNNPDLLVNVDPGSPNYEPGEFSISFDHITHGKNIHGEPITGQGEVFREIENGVIMPINITMEEVFSNPVSGNTMLGTMIRFNESLHTNDQDGIRNAIDEISEMMDALLSAQAKNGSRVNRFETTLERNEQQTASTVELLSNLEDTDMAEAIMKFSLAENVYNAALKSASRVIQVSLVNFL